MIGTYHTQLTPEKQWPETFHRDPGDRSLVATARVLDATLVTQDESIIASRLVRTLP
jgi:PIN domain nuclease of toxin-antitoxin system